jgi:hypothetical protein
MEVWCKSDMDQGGEQSAEESPDAGIRDGA